MWSKLPMIFTCDPKSLFTVTHALYMCSMTPETAKVSSSYSHKRGPGIGCWFSDHSNNPCCWHVNFKYCRIQGVDNNNWGLYCRHPLLLYLRRLGAFQSGIPLFTLTWPAKHSPNQGWESRNRIHLYLLGGVFYSPWHRALGRRDLDFTVSSEWRWRAMRMILGIQTEQPGVVYSIRATHPSTGPAGWPLNPL